jgi:hypothetical protein
MRWSTLFIPTLREPQAHQLLERAGYIREVSHRNFAYLPLAQRSLLKIQHIVRAEMNAIGGQEIRLPLSGGSSAEEMVKAIAKAELRSHKQLPQVWYQIQAGAADSFVFGADASGLAAAHQRICGRCGLECSAIETGLVIYSAAGESLVALWPMRLWHRSRLRCVKGERCRARSGRRSCAGRIFHARLEDHSGDRGLH